MSTGRVLIIAGSDSGGGAGIQADLKSVTALGGYAATAITALTAQDTHRVYDVFPVDPNFIQLQIRVVLGDIGADALKTGMLGSPAVIEAVAGAIENHGRAIPLVVDPVMVAKGGDPLLPDDAVAALKSLLVARADLVTPNLPEAGVLVGHPVESEGDMARAAEAILALGPKAVLVKGGHLPGDQVVDLLVTTGGTERFVSPRVDTRHTHGTGCTLASACATGLAQGLPLRDAVARARRYVAEAIRTAPGLGHGNGPLNHGHTVSANWEKNGAG